uniref:Soluble lamin-associated protein of 75 kDa n=1 Tax=Buteo japonicus TaxID=224669 RepID=A0A8C0B329_9AVES
MAFPVDMLNSYSHEDLENSAEDYLSNLRRGDPNWKKTLLNPTFPVPISLSTVGFVPLYGEEQTHKVLALFAPEDLFTAVALHLADRWWSTDDILRTSVPSREGLQQVKSVGERVVLYVLNRIIYRKQEIERNEIPFLCHGSNDYAKIMWTKGEAVGFYSVKPTGSICSSSLTQSYQLPVLDTMFVRKKHRGKDFGLIMLEDFAGSFTEDTLGLRYPLSSFTYIACKHYLEKYPGDRDLFWEVEGAGCWFQRTPITTVLQREKLRIAGMDALFCFLMLCKSCTANSQKGKESIDVHASTSEDPDITPISIQTQSSHLKRPRIGKNSQESEPETSQGNEENVLHVSERAVVVQPLVSSINCPFDCFGTLPLPLQVLNANDSEVLTEESTSVEKGTEDHHQESEKKLSSTENAAASAPKEEPSDNGLPNSMVIEVAEESVSENILPKTASSVEDQNEEAGHNSQEAPVALSRSSLIVVELEGVSFQQPSGQEVQKNQLEEHMEESAEQMDQYTQTMAERAADSSSEEAEIEVPIVDRRNLRRKAKGYKGPPKKKGKPV